MFFDSLQVIRALAALSVVLVHLAPTSAVGDFGVDVFFVLSGTVMAMIGDKTSPGRFILRRFIRVFPLYFLCTTCMALLLLVTGRDLGIGPLWPAYFKSIFFIPYEAPNGTIVPLLPPGWSLNFEMFFYGLMAVLMWLARSPAAKAAACLITLSIAGSFLGVAGPGRIYVSPLLAHFAVGVAVWHFRPRLPLLSQGRFLGLVLAGFLILALLQHLAIDELSAALGPGNWPRVLLYGPVSAAIVWLALGTRPGDLPRWLVRIGDESYATYLTHMFVVYLALILVPATTRTPSIQLAIVSVGMPAAVILGHLVHRFVDDPMQRWLRAKAG